MLKTNQIYNRTLRITYYFHLFEGSSKRECDIRENDRTGFTIHTSQCIA